MYSESIEYRVNKLLEHQSELQKLMTYGWSNKSIALYLGCDIPTVKRVISMLKDQ